MEKLPSMAAMRFELQQQERITELERNVRHLTMMLDNAEREIESLRGCHGGTCDHSSDCAIHNEPAYPAGACDCKTPNVELTGARRASVLNAKLGTEAK